MSGENSERGRSRMDEARLIDWLKMRKENSERHGSRGDIENVYYDGEAYAFELVLRKIALMKRLEKKEGADK